MHLEEALIENASITTLHLNNNALTENDKSILNCVVSSKNNKLKIIF